MWRKVLQVCNKKIAFSLVVLFSVCFTFAQSIEMPSMPEMPDMPSVSLDGTFYTPTIPKNVPKKQEEKTKENDNKNETVLTNANSDTDLLSTLLGVNSSYLTANDISGLYDSGAFSDISSLNSTSVLSNYATTTSTNVLLQQVLNSLNELKQQQKSSSLEKQEELVNTQVDAQNFKQREPSILRFKINGYNIADSLTKVFFSDTEPDGTFLLTGDRRYFAGQRQMSETFYILFKTVSSNGSSVTYKVQPSIVQDVKNENSYVYKLAETKNLTAEKTGNLVVMHFTDNNLNVDLLLDIDRK